MWLLYYHNKESSISSSGKGGRFIVMRFWIGLLALFCSLSLSLTALAIEPYPQSQSVFDETDEVNGFWLILGQLRKVNGELRPEKQEFKEGRYQRKRIIYQIPAGYSSQSAFSFFSNQGRGDVLYQCEKRRCGASNFWANNIFKQSRLNGLDRSQFYQVRQWSESGVHYYQVIYTIQRGNKRVYAYIEQWIRDKPSTNEQTNSSEVKPSSAPIDTLKQLGWILIPDMHFADEETLLSKSQKDVLKMLFTQITSDPTFNESEWVVVVHQSLASMDDEAALKISQLRGEQIVQDVKNVTGSPFEISSFGVGAHVPSRLVDHSNAVVLIRR